MVLLDLAKAALGWAVGTAACHLLKLGQCLRSALDPFDDGFACVDGGEI